MRDHREDVRRRRETVAHQPAAHGRGRAAHAAEAMDVDRAIRFERQIDRVEDRAHAGQRRDPRVFYRETYA